jgi:proline utilization trans-activator
MQEIPTESEARRLLEVVIFYVGETQHHFDVREFADGLGVFYANPQDSVQQQTPWFLEMLLILAIGQLFSGCIHDQNEIPGSKLFHYAYKHLPTLGELYTHGVLGVEILALVAVYLQNLNRKDEAYLHVCVEQ